MQMLSDLHRSGRTVLVVTHDIPAVTRFATHVIRLLDGRVVTQEACEAADISHLKSSQESAGGNIL